jgi:hypothetical protein
MKKWLSEHQIMFMAAGILLGYFVMGYAAFIDGVYFRKVATIYPQPSIDGCVTHVTKKGTYKRGDMVEAMVNIDKYRNVESTIQWNLMDARFYPYAPRRGSVPVGKHILNVPIERIPMHIPPGEYYFSGTVKYEPNAVSDIFIPVRTNKFEVVE